MYLYRHEDIGPEAPFLILRVFIVVRATPCGFRIRPVDDPDAKTRWVQDIDPRGYRGEKRYAYRVLEHAWKSYCIRKRKQLAHLTRYLARTQEIVNFIDHHQANGNPPPVPLPRPTRPTANIFDCDDGLIRLRAPAPTTRGATTTFAALRDYNLGA